jgi:hypothetical protein
MRRRYCTASLIACSGLALSATASAADVRWEAASGCPTQEELAQRVERALGAAPAQAAPEQFTARAARTASGYEARLEVTSARSAADKVRLLRATDCDKLTDLVALAIALAVEAEGQAAAITPAAATPQLTANVPAARNTQEPSADALSTIEASGGGTALELGAWMIADSGTQPRVAVAPALAIQLSWRHIQLHAGVAFFMPQEVYGTSIVDVSSAFPGPVAGVYARRYRPLMEIDVLVADLTGCGALWGSFRHNHALALCGGLEVGSTHAKPMNVTVGRSAHDLWLAPSASAEAFIAVPSTSLRVALSLGALVPVSRQDFLITGEATARYRAAAVPLRASLGLNWVLW